MQTCPKCGVDYGIGEWPWCPHGRPYGKQGGVVHPSERTVVFHNPATGQIAYPPTNDAPMERYRSWGYERVELPTLREREAFGRQHNVQCEDDGFDRGSGRADTMPEPRNIDLTGIEFGTKFDGE